MYAEKVPQYIIILVIALNSRKEHKNKEDEKVKRKLLLLLSAALIFGITACGSTADNEDTQQAVSESVSDVEAEAGDGQTVGTEVSDETKEEQETGVTIEEQVVLDWEGLTVTAISLEEPAYEGDSSSLKMQVENNTSYGISLSNMTLYVNGCYLYSDYETTLGDVPAGKKANVSLNLGKGEKLNIAGITEIGSIQAQFQVRDNSMNTLDDSSILYTSDPVEIKTSAYDRMDTSAISDGTELYNQDGVRIVAKELKANWDVCYELYFYVENTTDQDIVITCYDVTVDDFVPEETVSMYTQIPAGTYTIGNLEIYFDSQIPDAAAMENISEIEFGLKAYDPDNYNYYDDEAVLFDTGMIIFEP